MQARACAKGGPRIGFRRSSRGSPVGTCPPWCSRTVGDYFFVWMRGDFYRATSSSSALVSDRGGTPCWTMTFSRAKVRRLLTGVGLTPRNSLHDDKCTRGKVLSSGKVRAPRAILKGARVALDLEQEELARLAGLSRPTVSAFENSKVRTYEKTRSAIQTALESRGVVFTNGDRPGFYMDKRKKSRAQSIEDAAPESIDSAKDQSAAGAESSGELDGSHGPI